MREELALTELHRACGARVLNTAMRFLQNHACAEEVSSDTFLQVWNEAPRFRPERASVIGWILMIARSRAIDAVRRRSTRATHEVQDDDAVDAATDDGQAAPSECLWRRHLGIRVADVIGQLEPLQRQLIWLAFFEGLSHPEVAAHSGLPLGTVKSHLRRTLVRLRVVHGPAGRDDMGMQADVRLQDGDGPGSTPTPLPSEPIPAGDRALAVPGRRGTVVAVDDRSRPARSHSAFSKDTP